MGWKTDPPDTRAKACLAGGGTDHIKNLQLLCSTCNSLKDDRKQTYLIAKLRENCIEPRLPAAAVCSRNAAPGRLHDPYVHAGHNAAEHARMRRLGHVNRDAALPVPGVRACGPVSQSVHVHASSHPSEQSRCGAGKPDNMRVHPGCLYCRQSNTRHQGRPVVPVLSTAPLFPGGTRRARTATSPNSLVRSNSNSRVTSTWPPSACAAS